MVKTGRCVLPKSRVDYHTKKLVLRGTRPRPHFAQNGSIAPKLPWSSHHLTSPRILNLVRIDSVLPDLFPKDWFFGTKKSVTHLNLQKSQKRWLLSSTLIFTSDKGRGNINAIARDVCLSVCEQDYSKTHAWIWMKCCVSTDVGTWTNWSTFEPDPDHSADPGTMFTPDFCISAGYLKKLWVDFDKIYWVDSHEGLCRQMSGHKRTD